MDMIDVSLAASQAAEMLARSGGAGNVETKQVEVFQETACNARTDEPNTYRLYDFLPEVGKKYEVTVDGVTTTSTARTIELEGALMGFIGNSGISGIGEDTGENFAILFAPGVTMPYIPLVHRTKMYPESVVVRICVETEIIFPIDPKYLGCGYEKTMLYDGTPTKMDFSAAGMGYAYLLSSEDLFSRARGQNVHYEYKLADGATAHGVLGQYDYMAELSVPMLYGAFALLYAPTLGGTGVSFNYADVGEVTNLKLWTEYSESKPYYVTGYHNGTNRVFHPTDKSKAMAAAREMRLAVRCVDNGGNPVYYTPSRVVDYSQSVWVYFCQDAANGLQSIYIETDQPVEG